MAAIRASCSWVASASIAAVARCRSSRLPMAGTASAAQIPRIASTSPSSTSACPACPARMPTPPWPRVETARRTCTPPSECPRGRGRKTPSQAPSRWIVTLDGPRPRPPMISPHPATFQLAAPYQPAGAPPQAIEKLVDGFEAGLAAQTLLGVTGSGKTYTIANVIQRVQKPTLVMAPNKTLAAQLYGEFKQFFPHNAVEYFVSYYDYYQPEAY